MKDALDVHRSLLAREVPHEVIRLPRLVLSADEIPDAIGPPGRPLRRRPALPRRRLDRRSDRPRW